MIYRIILLLGLISALVACEKDDKVKLSDKALILQFAFTISNNTGILQTNANGIIDQNNKTILISVPYGTDISSLKPEITISEKATINPANREVNDFSNKTEYTVTAENEDFKSVYSVEVYVEEPNHEAKITKFLFLSAINGLRSNIMGQINEDEKSISIAVPIGTDLTNLTPSIESSSNSVITPNSTISQNFTNTINYTVTAQDGTTKSVYSVFVTIPDLVALKAIYNANPQSQGNLGWDIDNPASISDWEWVRLEEGWVTGIFLSYDLLENLPSEACIFPKLTELVLCNNSISSLPSEIKNLKNLNKLDVRYNKLTELPNELFTMSHIDILFIGGNLMTTIPSGVFQMTGLVSLEFSNAMMTSIPLDLFKIVNLEYLWLGYNSLTSIPKEIGSFNKLMQLDLSHNSLSTLPLEMGNLETLAVLYLEGNSLTEIPLEVCNLVSNLDYCDIRLDSLCP